MKHAPRTRVVILTLLTTLAVLVAGVVGQRVLSSKKSPPRRKPPRAKSLVVEVLTAESVSHTVTLSGFASATAGRTVSLAAEVSGKVVTANEALRAGGFIDKGQPLFSIDGERLRIRVETGEADVARTKARLRALTVQRKGARQTVKDSKGAVALTRKQLSREEKLAGKGHISGAVVDRTKLELNQRIERLHTASTQADLLAHTIAQTQAELTVSEKNLEQSTMDRDRAAVVAPFDLQVVSSKVEVSHWLNTGQTAAVVDDISTIELGVEVPADDLTWLPAEDDQQPATRSEWVKLLTGRTATVYRTGSDGRERHWSGVVHRIGPGLSVQTRMVTLFIRVAAPLASTPDSPPLPLLPGMFCRTDIPGRTIGDVYVLPRKALQEPNVVYIADPEDKLRRRAVSVVRQSGDHVVVDSGISAGDRIIVTTLGEAVDGSKLKVRERAKTRAVSESTEKGPKESEATP